MDEPKVKTLLIMFLGLASPTISPRLVVDLFNMHALHHTFGCVVHQAQMVHIACHV